MNVVEEFLADAQKLGRTMGVANQGIKKTRGGESVDYVRPGTALEQRRLVKRERECEYVCTHKRM